MPRLDSTGCGMSRHHSTAGWKCPELTVTRRFREGSGSKKNPSAVPAGLALPGVGDAIRVARMKWDSLSGFRRVSQWKFRSSKSTRTTRRTSNEGGRGFPKRESWLAMAGRLNWKTVMFFPSSMSATTRISTLRPSPALAMKRQCVGAAVSTDTKFEASRGEMNPSALTQTRMRLAKTCRSTGTSGWRLAPRRQSYLEWIRPKSRQSRAMPPRPLVSKTVVFWGSGGTDGKSDGTVSRYRRVARTRGSEGAYRSSSRRTFPRCFWGGIAAMCPSSIGIDSSLYSRPCGWGQTRTRNGWVSRISNQCPGGTSVMRLRS